MSVTVLEAQGLGKAYRRYRSQWLRVLGWFGWRGADGGRQDEQWVVRDISLSLQAGEVVGIIGHNGAGKSTLLKMITGTLQPSSGSVRRHGRVGAILELGLGFHPELSGRANARHALGLMGFASGEIDGLLPQVEAFAEIGDYFAQPVRMYSSGMQMRLAFAVVTAQRPELLIIDEALAVGDAYFQQKCFERIRAFRAAGSALLFVSHDLNAVKLLCDRALVLDHGRCVFAGEAEAAAVHYNQLIARLEERDGDKAHFGQRLESGFGSGEAQIVRGWLEGEAGNPGPFAAGETVTVCLQLRNLLPQALTVTLGILLRDRFGQDVFGVNTDYLDQALVLPAGGEATGEVVARFRLVLRLGPGAYTLTAALHGEEHHLERCHHWADGLLSFEVAGFRGARFVGLAGLETAFSVTAAVVADEAEAEAEDEAEDDEQGQPAARNV